MSDNKKCVHAELMVQYAHDAMRTDKPWELWEGSCNGGEWWENLRLHPTWDQDIEYRRKPEIINVSFPKPVCYKLEKGQEYWTISLNGDVLPYRWSGIISDYRRLDDGFIHLTEEAAKQRAEALIKITRGGS
ncbi:hypothetical protein [Photorhabdus temperata]|uniref:hypothetical protein n=1 Tax=Photorhabdus temperata TaxID=574560 RepID=UPI00038A2772|nr:hypothetical protein [Photorhabdus temperata]EQB98555.1 hypothetical protein B738_23970 [Photorhabdus temperata subsp. temperata M1021]